MNIMTNRSIDPCLLLLMLLILNYDKSIDVVNLSVLCAGDQLALLIDAVIKLCCRFAADVARIIVIVDVGFAAAVISVHC
mmetsp:Transcript_16746/g.38517  ORF Transcript_16746/g.38517 Transcript_16746/m.38517 type:complete len:80 (-) Transcript_16746:17-256(-)